MFETLDKLMLAGLGALSMTRERAEEIFDEYVERGQAEKDSRSGFVKEVMDNADKTRKELEDMIETIKEEEDNKLNDMKNDFEGEREEIKNHNVELLE